LPEAEALGLALTRKSSHQPLARIAHRNRMRLRTFAALSGLAAMISVGLACSPNESPNQLRQQTAQATQTVKQDTRAIAEGVKDGLSSKKSVDINHASKDDLLTLPGITSERAGRIIAGRPYASTNQLVTRHVLSEDEYRPIEARVTVSQ
jgi:DNA uptake protein ComE-like DNA-binding protein